MPDRSQIQTLEELSLNALPCLQQVLYDGWILRFAEGYTKRANSVTPLYSGTLDLNEKIQYCQSTYRRLNRPPIFRLADIPRLAALDRTLEQLGYSKQDPVSVRAIALAGDRSSNNELFPTMAYDLTQEWLDLYVHAVDLPVNHWNTLATMLQIIPHPTCYGWLRDRQRFCSCGLAVLERDYLGLYFIATTEKQRGKGYARQLISALLDWGKHHGATKAYVQVELNNRSAISLYDKLGFSEIYQYFYRTI